jgi:diaminohydroxyphosphoribosylaminopyrimidine deaminase/5-amino-6-(5-phosphoribosylamino)uracil reductase
MAASNRPRITLKLATSLDGKIALASGESKWITGPQSRDEVHRMRAAHEAILTGIGTILADDPEFTARTGNDRDQQPDLIVMGGRRKLANQARIFENQTRKVTFYEDRDLAAATAGYSSIMIEAGSRIAGAAIKAGIVDRIDWFRAPIIIGGTGIPVIADFGLDTLSAAPKFKRVALTARGDDIHESYERIR